MKDIKIYSVGSCRTDTRVGKYEVLLEYGIHRRYLERTIDNATANRCILEGFIDAVGSLKEACRVEFISTTKLGLSGLRKNKGPNVDLLQTLISLLAERQCEFVFTETTGRGEEINAYIAQFKKINRAL